MEKQETTSLLHQEKTMEKMFHIQDESLNPKNLEINLNPKNNGNDVFGLTPNIFPKVMQLLGEECVAKLGFLPLGWKERCVEMP